MEQRRLRTAMRCLSAGSVIAKLFLLHCCFECSKIHISQFPTGRVLHTASSTPCWLTISEKANIGFERFTSTSVCWPTSVQCWLTSAAVAVKSILERLSYPSLHSSTRRLLCRPHQSQLPPSSSSSWPLWCCSASHCLWSSERWSALQPPAVSKYNVFVRKSLMMKTSCAGMGKLFKSQVALEIDCGAREEFWFVTTWK